jgi:hypothetical protein
LAGDVMAILDTGADSTVLPFVFASMLIPASNLETARANAVGGTAKIWKVRGAPSIEVEIGGTWMRLPSLMFAEKTPPLLGRDVIFANFDLRMTMGETELRRFPKSNVGASLRRARRVP